MKKLLIPIIFSTTVFADFKQGLIIDAYLSPYIGADDLITAHEFAEKTKFLQFIHPAADSPILSKIARFSELFLVWDPLNYSAMIAQHEIFGHGYRVRSLQYSGAEVTEYKIGVPPPYGVGGGYTRFRWDPSQTTVFQSMCITSGGVESTAILANRLRLQWLKEQKIQPRQTSLYLFSQHDITHYILQSHENLGGDIGEYTHSLNYLYGNDKLTIKELKKKALLNFLDPFTYYSLYAWGSYIANGKKPIIPMIPIGSYKYLPSIRMGFTPFGPEYYLENFLIKEEVPLYLYLRGGSFAGHQYTGLGIECSDLWRSGPMSLGFRADVWLQPAIDLRDLRFSCSNLLDGKQKNLHFYHSRLGTSISLIYQRKIWSEGTLFLQVGGKTQGFIPGEELSSGMILRIGLTLC